MIINLTPHAINIVTETGDIIATFEPSGTVARCNTKTVEKGNLDGIPITSTEFGEVENLPEQKEDTYYIVSTLVAQSSKRNDLLVPAEQVRDDKGRVIGCLSLGRVQV